MSRDGPPRYVFLDTQFFDQQNYDFVNATFRALAEHGRAGRLRILLPRVTETEIRSHIAEKARDAARATRQPAIIRNSQIPEAKARLLRVDDKALEAEVLCMFDELLKRCNVIRVDSDRIPFSRVQADYIARRPPFARAKSKEEFPDAIAIAALQDWCAAEDAAVAVVSMDRQIAAACGDDGPLVIYDQLLDYVADLTRAAEEGDSKAAMRARIESAEPFVLAQVRERIDEIRTKGSRAFADRGFILDDVEGEVTAIDVKDVELTEPNAGAILLISEGYALIAVPGSVTFDAAATYKKPGTGSWDSEDRVMMFQDVVSETIACTRQEEFLVEVEFEDSDPDSFKIVSVQFENTEDVVLNVDEDDGWPYK